jgi:hypothetical protein
MDFGITEKIDQIQQLFAGQNGSMIIVLGLVVLIFWFLPAILAAFLNRKHFKKILLACIPAGFSFIAWFALIGWAATGKITEKKHVDNSEEKK